MAKKTLSGKIMLSFLRENKRSLILKIIALTLVAISIAASIYFIDSFQPQFSRKYMVNLRGKQSDVILSFEFSPEDFIGEHNQTVDKLVLAETLATNFANQFSGRLGNATLSYIFTRLGTFAFSFLNGTSSTISIVNANLFALQQLDNYSINKNASVSFETGGILIIDQSQAQYSPGKFALFNESSALLSNGYSDISENNFTINFHSKILADFNEVPYGENITKIVGGSSFTLVVSDTIFKNYLAFINISTGLFDLSASAHITIDYSEFNYKTRALFQEQISQFLTAAEKFIYEEYTIKADFTYVLMVLLYLEALNNVLFIIKILILVLTIPAILFALLILIFSNLFFATKRSKIFAFYYLKGMSIKQLFFFAFSENALALATAFPIGASLAIPLTILMVKGTSAIPFPGATSLQLGYSFTFNPYNLLCVGLLLLFLSLSLIVLDLKPILSQKVEHKTLEDEDKIDEQITTWKKFHFDFLFLLLGCGLLLLNEVFLKQQTSNFITQFFIYFVGTLIILAAISLLFLRVFPQILTTAGERLWQKRGGFFSFSTKLFTTRKKVLTRNILSLALCISYLLILLQIGATINHLSTSQAYFNVGAEARIDFSSSSNISDIIVKLPQTINFTEITKLQLKNYLTNRELSLYVINTSTFLSVAYFKEEFIPDSNPSSAVAQLEQNMTFIANRGFVTSGSKPTGYNYSITLFYGSTERQTLELKDYYTVWPFFADENTRGDNFIIGKKTGEVLQEYSYTQSHHLLLRFEESEEKASLIKQLQEEILTSSEKLVLLEDGYKQFWTGEPFWFIIKTFSMNNLFLLCFLFSILSILITTTLENNRKTEIGMFLALGLRPKQIFLLSFIEQLTVLLAGVIFGLIIGIPSAAFLTGKLKGNLSIPIGSLENYWLIGVLVLGVISFNLIIISSGALRTASRKVSYFIQELELQNELDD